MMSNADVSASSREIYGEAKRHQEEARRLMDQDKRQEAAIHAASAYESARKAYGD
jgi:hypothetical protein